MKNDCHGITGFFGSPESQYKVPINTGSQSIHYHHRGSRRRWSFDEGNKAYRYVKSGPYPFFKMEDDPGQGQTRCRTQM
jgi:hypothetical protein